LLLLGIGSEQLQRYNRRLTQERHAERERIARDLHDTLLQGVQALLFRLQIWETDGSLPPEFRRELAQTVSVAKEVVIEGRNRILMLRPNGDPPRDLLEALSQVGAPELGPHGPRLRLSVIGNPRPLKVEAVEHLVDIAREAIRNTVQHAGARRVEMRVKYAMRSLVMQIADDGSGIELSALRAQPGSLHFGLTGMRERAEQLGGRFQVYSHQPRGTHIEVTIPSWRVYEPTHNWSWGRGVMPA
jgi:signal transduction histidine kinase